MTPKEKMIETVLNRFFPHPKIPLKYKDSYTLLIAVLLSAQATDAKVNQITPLLFKKASTPEEMLLLSQEEIIDIIKPIGLFIQKSKALLGLSQILLEKHKGCVPKTFEELEHLPGVGHKTASVIMAQAFHIPAFPVDTHIHRCAKRWGLSNGKNVQTTEKNLKKIFPKNKWIKLHLQIIFFARKFCPAKGHKIEKCPICCNL